MPNISAHQSKSTTKMLLIGHPGSGKTGALASLPTAGYNLRIADTDNGLDVLKSYLTDPSSEYVRKCPDVAKRVEFFTATDPMKPIGGIPYPTKAIAWQRVMNMLSHWKEPGVDLGALSSWGPQDIFVLDSLSSLSTSALNFHLQLNGALGKVRDGNTGRRDVGATQALVRSFLEMLADDSIRCNVIVIAHIVFNTETGLGPQADAASGGTYSGFPAAIGRALSPLIPRWFNTMLLAQPLGSGPTTKLKIYTKPQGVVMSKTTNPLRVKDSYDLAWGLAEYFQAVRDPQPLQQGEPAEARAVGSSAERANVEN
jgi:hypothetical protein